MERIQTELAKCHGLAVELSVKISIIKDFLRKETSFVSSVEEQKCLLGVALLLEVFEKDATNLADLLDMIDLAS